MAELCSRDISCFSGNAQKASKGLTTLVNAQRTAELLAQNLEEINQVISEAEFSEELQGNPNPEHLTTHYAAALDLYKHHEQSLSKLEALTGDLGLLQIKLPARELAQPETEFLKLLVIARSTKTTLWLKISRYHDEINPLRESRRRGGKALLGQY